MINELLLKVVVELVVGIIELLEKQNRIVSSLSLSLSETPYPQPTDRTPPTNHEQASNSETTKNINEQRGVVQDHHGEAPRGADASVHPVDGGEELAASKDRGVERYLRRGPPGGDQGARGGQLGGRQSFPGARGKVRAGGGPRALGDREGAGGEGPVESRGGK